MLRISGLINRAIQGMPAAVFCNTIMVCFGERRWGGLEGSGVPWGFQTQSALREGLLDLVQHIPKQRRLITFSVNGHRLTRSFDKQTDMVTLD